MVGATSLRALSAYAMPRLPLALLELPLFVALPAFYADNLGLALATVGSVLFSVRLLDAVIDPMIGGAIDRHRHRLTYRGWILAGLPLATAGLAALFLPPVRGGALVVWLAVASTLTCLAYSMITIAHQSWGAEIGLSTDERARVTATREGFGVIGVLAASALLAPERAHWLVAAFAALALLAGLALPHAPDPIASSITRHTPAPGGWMRTVLRNRAFRALLLAFTVNGIANAIPATLLLFFVRDVLAADAVSASWGLGAYFLSGALGLPVWVVIAKRVGLRMAWLCGMVCAVMAFIWAMRLGAGDTAPFLAICVLSGFALGSDLALPGALLATVIARAGHSARHEGGYFGVWSLATKFSLAAAAGLALPLLQWMDYTPGGAEGIDALRMVYAALPCALKLAAGAVLLITPDGDD